MDSAASAEVEVNKEMITMDSFQAMMNLKVIKLKQMERARDIAEIIRILRDAKIAIDESELPKLAADAIDKGSIIAPNGIGGSCKPYDDVERISQVHRERYDCVYLFANAPTDRRRLTLEQDTLVRMRQIEDFKLKFIGTATTRQVHKNLVVTAHSYHDLESQTRKFLQNSGIHAYTVWILFNGHGSEDGLVFQEDGDVPLNKFLTDIKGACFEPDKFPKEICVHFTQCYGHLFDPQLANERMSISCYTTPERPINIMTYVLSGDSEKQYVIETKHSSLDKLADQEGKKQRRESNLLPSTTGFQADEVSYSETLAVGGSAKLCTSGIDRLPTRKRLQQISSQNRTAVLGDNTEGRTPVFETRNDVLPVNSSTATTFSTPFQATADDPVDIESLAD